MSDKDVLRGFVLRKHSDEFGLNLTRHARPINAF